jgi:Holliday junction resolvasome RuvABC endonuclease subunit
MANAQTDIGNNNNTTTTTTTQSKKKSRFLTRICLDPSKACTGWAIMDDDTLLAYGSESFNDCHDAADLYIAFYSFLSSLFEKGTSHGVITHLAFENSWKQPGKAGIAYNAINMAILVFCKNHNIIPEPIAPTSIKLALTGSGMGEKNQVMDAINKMYGLSFRKRHPGPRRKNGWNPDDFSDTDHNISDAIAVGVTAFYKEDDVKWRSLSVDKSLRIVRAKSYGLEVNGAAVNQQRKKKRA